MVYPELKYLHSPDLEFGKSPVNPKNCSVFIQAAIGPKNEEYEEMFNFEVVTPYFLAENSVNRWGRGYLVLDVFSWEQTKEFILKLISSCTGNSWDEVANNLNKELNWEFENYNK